MGLKHAGFLSLLLCSAFCQQFSDKPEYGTHGKNAEKEWMRLQTLIEEEAAREAPPSKGKSWKGRSSMPEAKMFPKYKIVTNDHKEFFRPERGVRPVPDVVNKILLPSRPATPVPGGIGRPKLVEMLCHVDRIYVRVRSEIFRNRKAYKYLKLGTCPVNAATKEHYYLLYLLKTDCGFKRKSKPAYLSILNMLRYLPTTPVFWEMPFAIFLQCKYPRFFLSYSPGFYPILKGGTIFRALQPRSRYILILQDVSGKEITGTKTFILGEQICFMASEPGISSSGNRLYINKCFTTASQEPYSTPRHTVIDNYGCMNDSKLLPQSMFLRSDSLMVQRFCVNAFAFKNQVSTPATHQFHMHCNITIGPLTPTQSSKACTYDLRTRRWRELYGPDSVCDCCASKCMSAQPRASRGFVSTHPWKIHLNSEDDGVEVDPKMKSSLSDEDFEDLLPTEQEDFEHPLPTEQEDFEDFWDQDD